jgi:hypothetical protein
MNRAIRIFRKDVAHLRPQILAFVGLLAAFYADDVFSGDFNGISIVTLDGLILAALPLSCWLLVTSLIQQEPAVGDRQYWLTRPFNRTDLLAAKALFLVTFVLAPVFVCQALMLAQMPQPPGLDVAALLAKQAFFLAWYVLPIAAMAAVTRNLGEAFLGSLIVLLGYSLFLSVPVRSGWNGLLWIREILTAAIALGGGAVVIYLQYTRRRTILGRGVLAGVLLFVGATLALPPVQAAFRVQSWFSSQPVDPNAVRISFDDRHDAAGKPVFDSPSVGLRIPLRVEDVPPGLEIIADWVSLESPWRSGWSGLVYLSRKPDWSIQLAIPASAYQPFKDAPVRLRGSLDLTLIAPSAPQCREYSGGNAECLWNPQVFAPFPTSPWFEPLESYTPGTHPLTRPVAHIERSFDLGPLRLSDYLVSK